MRARRIEIASMVCAGIVLLPAGAASAHGSDQTNYDSVVTATEPPTSSITVHVIELGSRIELTVASGHTVEVQGYLGEPYLRLGPDGVYENLRSPAHWLNADRYGTHAPPPDVAASDPPRWVRISSGHTARWHDHRTHWMATVLPPVVQPSPGKRHLIAQWTIPLTVDRAPTSVIGRLSWIPAPPAFPWLALSAAVAVILVAALWWRPVATTAVLAAAVAALAGELVALVWRTGHLPWVATTWAGAAAAAVATAIIVKKDPTRRALLATGAVCASAAAFTRLGVLHHSLVRFPGGRPMACAVAACVFGAAMGAGGGVVSPWLGLRRSAT